MHSVAFFRSDLLKRYRQNTAENAILVKMFLLRRSTNYKKRFRNLLASMAQFVVKMSKEDAVADSNPTLGRFQYPDDII